MKVITINGKCNICGRSATGYLEEEEFQFFNNQTREWDWYEQVQVDLLCDSFDHPGPRPGGIGYETITYDEFQRLAGVAQ